MYDNIEKKDTNFINIFMLVIRALFQKLGSHSGRSELPRVNKSSFPLFNKQNGKK